MNSAIVTQFSDELASLAAKLRHSTVKVYSNSPGVGSGVIWQSDGLIVTNAHVAITNKAKVELADGRVFELFPSAAPRRPEGRRWEE